MYFEIFSNILLFSTHNTCIYYIIYYIFLQNSFKLYSCLDQYFGGKLFGGVGKNVYDVLSDSREKCIFGSRPKGMPEAPNLIISRDLDQ